MRCHLIHGEAFELRVILRHAALINESRKSPCIGWGLRARCAGQHPQAAVLRDLRQHLVLVGLRVAVVGRFIHDHQVNVFPCSKLLGNDREPFGVDDVEVGHLVEQVAALVRAAIHYDRLAVHAHVEQFVEPYHLQHRQRGHDEYPADLTDLDQVVRGPAHAGSLRRAHLVEDEQLGMHRREVGRLVLVLHHLGEARRPRPRVEVPHRRRCLDPHVAQDLGQLQVVRHREVVPFVVDRPRVVRQDRAQRVERFRPQLQQQTLARRMYDHWGEPQSFLQGCSQPDTC
jgi:hypothetical protein